MAAARVLQLLRSTQTYTSFNAAKAKIESLTGHKDGEIILARYGTGTPDGETATQPFFSAIGVYDAGHTKWTVFKSSTEIEAAIAALQTELDNTQTGAGLGTNGAYTAPAAGEAGYEVLGGDNAPANLKDAIMKLADEIAGMDYSYNTNASDTTASAAVNDRSKVIASISEVNGDITVGSTAAVDLLLTGYQKGSQTGAIAATDTVKDAFTKLENTVGQNKITNADHTINISPAANGEGTDINVNIKTGEKVLHKDGNAGLWTDIKIQKVIPTGTDGTDEIVDGNLGTNVREAYRLMSNNGSGTYVQLGKDINVYKDSSLISVQLGTMGDTLTNEDANQKSDVSTIVPGTGDDALVFVYYLGDENKYQRASINVESFLTDSEYGIGLAVESDGAATNSKRVYVKKDTNSEKVITAYSESGNTTADVLTISNDGVKVANIQAAIKAAVGRAQTTINTTVNKSGETVANPHISIAETTADNGSKSYTFTETDIDSQARAIAAEKVLADSINGTGSYNETTGVATAYTSPAGATYANTNNVKGDIAALDAAAANGLDSVSGSNAIDVGTKANKDQSISLILDDSTVGNGQESTGNNNALSVTSDGLFLSTIWDCGEYE